MDVPRSQSTQTCWNKNGRKPILFSFVWRHNSFATVHPQSKIDEAVQVIYKFNCTRTRVTLRAKKTTAHVYNLDWAADQLSFHHLFLGLICRWLPDSPCIPLPPLAPIQADRWTPHQAYLSDVAEAQFMKHVWDGDEFISDVEVLDLAIVSAYIKSMFLSNCRKRIRVSISFRVHCRVVGLDRAQGIIWLLCKLIEIDLST